MAVSARTHQPQAGADKISTRWMVALMMVLLSGLTYWLYQRGFSAGFQFDDAGSISGVSGVHNVSSALAYLFDGRTGSLGRPLSLVTFLLQKESWPNDPGAFFMFNALIHIFNGVLVFWLSYRLTQFFPEKFRNPTWFSLAVTALWMTLPLHVSASLMAVQRMTTLSSMFMLLGLVGYVSGRALLDKSPVRAYGLMSVSLVMGTVLALLCKENGALLPLYVLVLETTLIRVAGVPPSNIWFKRWIWVFLGAPVLLVAAYFVYSWPTMMGGYGLRSFNLYERLLTETRILWDYFSQILLPARSGIGPYQDGYIISKGLFEPATTAVAIVGWISAIFAAWWVRKHYPVILFGLLWFLAGHVIESSFIPLELYFEHRNYIASFGPLLAVCVLIWQVPAKILRVSLAGLVLMVLLRLFVLSEITHIWGQPLLSAKLWSEEHPHSVRATLFLADVYSDAGDHLAARQTILESFARNRNDTTLALQSVYLSCPYDDQATFLSRVNKIEQVLSTGTLSKIASNLLRAMLGAQQRGECPHLTRDQLFRMADMILANPHSQAVPGALVDLHFFKSRLYAIEGKPEFSIRELLMAFQIKKEYQIAVAVARAMANAGYLDDARAFLDRAIFYAPRNPLIKQRWQMEFDSFKLSIEPPKVTGLPGKDPQ